MTSLKERLTEWFNEQPDYVVVAVHNAYCYYVDIEERIYDNMEVFFENELKNGLKVIDIISVLGENFDYTDKYIKRDNSSYHNYIISTSDIYDWVDTSTIIEYIIEKSGLCDTDILYILNEINEKFRGKDLSGFSPELNILAAGLVNKNVFEYKIRK